MLEFVLTAKFSDSFQKLDTNVQARVREKIKFLSELENPLVFSKKLRGYKAVYRYRIGDFRIIFRVANNKVFLLFIGHRKDIYEIL